MLDFKLCRSLEAYIRKHYIEEKKLLFSQYCLTTELEKDTEKPSVKENVCCYIWPEFIPQPDKNTFSSKLFRLIEKKAWRMSRSIKEPISTASFFPSCAEMTIIQARKRSLRWHSLCSLI